MHILTPVPVNIFLYFTSSVKETHCFFLVNILYFVFYLVLEGGKTKIKGDLSLLQKDEVSVCDFYPVRIILVASQRFNSFCD